MQESGRGFSFKAIQEKYRGTWFCRAVNYLPSVVILVFGMLALYSSLMLVRAHEGFGETGKKYSADLFRMQENFYEFEKIFELHLYQHEGRDHEALIRAFNVLNRDFESFLRDGYQFHDAAAAQAHLKIVSDVQSGFMDIARQIAEVRGDGPDGAAHKAVDEKIRRAIDLVRSGMAALQKDFVESAGGAFPLREIRSRQFALYWAVIAMGLSGFVLIVLNSDKLRQLQKNNEEKKETLALLENRLAAMEAAHDGILIVDREGRLSYMNRALQALHGIDSAQASRYIGKNWKEIYSPSDLYEIEENILPDLDQQWYWRGDFLLTARDGTTTCTELSLSRLPDGGMIGTMQDVSERHRAENEKKDLEEQFYQAQKMEAIGRLAGGIAHDFNNILAAMMGYAEFLVDDLEDGGNSQRFAKNIMKAGAQARELVDQILAFSRRSDTAKDGIDLVEPVQETVAMLQASLPKTIEVNTHIGVPEAPIWGNATQIKQLIMNLCVNARDAMDDDHGALEIGIEKIAPEDFYLKDAVKDALPDPKAAPAVRLEDGEAGQTRLILGHLCRDHDYICLRVRDTGCGMSRVIMERIFEPFFTTKPVEKGTGLGLATVHGVVVGHQGAMLIDSRLGQGTSFELYFPMDTAFSRSKEAEQGEVRGAKKQGRQDVCILLVEDQDDVRDMTMVMLERMGYEASACDSGLEALDVLRENPDVFDLVITDHNMPKMTGMELIHQAHTDFPDLPFVLLSGYSEEKIQALIDGHPAVKAVLRKPVGSGVLQECIRGVLGKTETAGKKVA